MAQHKLIFLLSSKKKKKGILLSLKITLSLKSHLMSSVCHVNSIVWNAEVKKNIGYLLKKKIMLIY